LLAVVERLQRLYPRVAIHLAEGNEVALGQPAGRTITFPVALQSKKVAELEIDGATGDEEEGMFLARVATLVSAYCLLATQARRAS
jgi:hypothetical protein